MNDIDPRPFAHIIQKLELQEELSPQKRATARIMFAAWKYAENFPEADCEMSEKEAREYLDRPWHELELAGLPDSAPNQENIEQ